METTFICGECGSDRIQLKYWVNPNTFEISDSCEDDECWCEKCQEITRWTIK